MATTLIATAPPSTAQALHQALADAPGGAYPLLEAALGWHELRPSGWHRTDAPARATAVAHVGTEAAATRLASLLSTLTWATVAPAGTGWRVEVPIGSYHRITRALTGAWRSRELLLAAPGPNMDGHQAALGLWRMALLVDAPELRPGALAVRVGSASTAQTLVAAARRLGLTAITDGPCDGRHAVRLIGRDQVHQLLGEATGRR
ncbi:hypothetical protein Cs7R123_58830 [Catellatospora sp. TT07R-123]|uniref:hypothetical protein n=1 Tax=Catellatospora sp. TT07R-123 TaxID=2733863 RepID=UPI001B06A743|nr:hypothetical protein [Catellatospora sp. TT07R-123]GHJ48541.1 hypothetical protein Cs7R123_58830 [Catellatospora sp. TT07R-123]